MSFVKVLSSLALAFTFHCASAEGVRQVHLEGRLESRGSQTVLIFQNEGRSTEMQLNTPLEDFRGLEVAIDGQLQNDLLVVEWMFTRTKSLINGKAGIGFYGIGSIEGGVQEPVFHPYLPENLRKEFGVDNLKLSFSEKMRSFNADASEAVVSGVIQNGKIHVSPSYGGFVIRRYVTPISPGHTVMFSAKLTPKPDTDAYSVEHVEGLNIKHDVSGVSIPGAMGIIEKLSAKLIDPAMHVQVAEHHLILIGELQAKGVVTIREIWADNMANRRMLANPIVLAAWREQSSMSVAAVQSYRRLPQAVQPSPSCEEGITAAPSKAPFLRVVK